MAILLGLWVACGTATAAHAQAPPPRVFSPGVLDNSIANLEIEGQEVWVGPYLTVTRDGGMTWTVADVDSLRGLRNRVYSLDIEDEVIWAGLGIELERVVDGKPQDVDLPRGFVTSSDGGTSWEYRSYLAPQDQDPETTGILDLPGDSLITYGPVQLRTLPITVPEISPPWDIDYDPVTGALWTASQLAGIRKSTDGGQSWRRIVLPPDTTRFLSPELGYDFPFYVQPRGIALDQFNGLNFQAFAVLVDGAGRVWAGTAGGLNRSLDGGRSWLHYTVDDGLSGNFIISIEEQERRGQDPAVWASAWRGKEETGRFGVVATRDGGATFQTFLVGEKTYDFAFDGTKIYVAGDNGLFISEDEGLTFRTVRNFHDPTQPDRVIRPGVRVFSVEANSQGLWVGTQDGLFKSTDGGLTWRIYRADVPLSPDGLPPIVPPERVPRVETYAYPNPFSPSSNQLIRIRYRLDTDGRIVIRIFDFGMNLVRDLFDGDQQSGEREVVWDGMDDRGARVANGSYFYAVQAHGETFWGKILVIE